MNEFSVTSNVSIAKGELDRRLPIILNALGREAEGNAVSEINKLVYDTPQSPNYVRMGRLKNSISHAVSGNDVYIGTNVEYAPYVELGTVHMAPRPFLRNGIANYIRDYERIVEEGLK